MGRLHLREILGDSGEYVSRLQIGLEHSALSFFDTVEATSYHAKLFSKTVLHNEIQLEIQGYLRGIRRFFKARRRVSPSSSRYQSIHPVRGSHSGGHQEERDGLYVCVWFLWGRQIEDAPSRSGSRYDNKGRVGKGEHGVLSWLLRVPTHGHDSPARTQHGRLFFSFELSLRGNRG